MKIGMICGCFDMFHIGHLNILEKCKNNCDFLLVGVCNDDYIRTKKNKEPVISEENRLRIIKALKCVDNAVLVNTEELKNKIALSKKYNVSIVFDGDDWKDDERYKKLEQAGIEVKFFPYTQGISTTQLRNKLKEQ